MEVPMLVNMGVLVTICLAVLRLAFQSGTANQTLKAVETKVDGLVNWKDQTLAQNALVQVELARVGATLESLERRITRLESPPRTL